MNTAEHAQRRGRRNGGPEQHLGKFTVAQSPSGLPPLGSSEPTKRSMVGHGVTSHFRRKISHGHEVAFRPADLKNPVEKSKLWELMAKYLSKDVKDIQQYICNHVEYTLARTRYNLDSYAAYQATALSVRDRLIESWNDTQQHFTNEECKRVYYMSLEFLMGRSLQNAIFNLDLSSEYAQALEDFGYHLEDLYEEENDAALGNGGLGRLAACFLDSLATSNYPGWGYGIRYNYGMFSQRIVDGFQVEFPDYWLTFGNPWEIERLDVFYPVHFYGHVESYQDAEANMRMHWEGGESVFAVAYDTPIPGYDTFNVINLRLWSSKPSREFDLQSFNSGDYISAIEHRRRAESVSYVLYPNDNTYSGKELRLKQQYFFSSATLQDVLRRFKKLNLPLSQLPDKVVIQLNDTHPTISIPELMRLLVDEEFMGWDEAWAVTRKVFAFTNHTVLPEALEKWPVSLMECLLPRHMQIIYEINYRFLKEVEARNPGDIDRIRRMSIIEEGDMKSVRMAYLAIVGSHSVNGVAEIHSDILRTSVFRDFHDMFPERFFNVTNGVTPRRWLAIANPKYADMISKWIEADDWLTDMTKLRDLADHVADPELQREWTEIRQYNKRVLAEYIQQTLNVTVDVDSLFDVQIKRIHEYKRQLLNVLYAIHRYDRLKRMTPTERRDVVKRTIMVGGKAAPGYAMAKLIIKLINSVADVVNNDPETSQYLKVLFLPNYNVSLAEVVIPATDLSQHISTAGTEASGTSNMKFAMNGCLIIGTMDGANIEIAKEIGEENMFIFGARKDEVGPARQRVRNGEFMEDSRLERVKELIRAGTFGDPELFASVLHAIDGCNDYYLVGYDFADYLEAQDRIDELYRNQQEWIKRSILSTAFSGFFSSDRSIKQYAERIWDLKECPRPDPYAQPNIPANIAAAAVAAAQASTSASNSPGSPAPTNGLGSASSSPPSSVGTSAGLPPAAAKTRLVTNVTKTGGAAGVAFSDDDAALKKAAAQTLSPEPNGNRRISSGSSPSTSSNGAARKNKK